MLVWYNASIMAYYSITYKSTPYLILIGNLAHFCLVIWHAETVIPYIVYPTLRQTYPSLSWECPIVQLILSILSPTQYNDEFVTSLTRQHLPVTWRFLHHLLAHS